MNNKLIKTVLLASTLFVGFSANASDLDDLILEGIPACVIGGYLIVDSYTKEQCEGSGGEYFLL